MHDLAYKPTLESTCHFFLFGHLSWTLRSMQDPTTIVIFFFLHQSIISSSFPLALSFYPCSTILLSYGT